MMPYARKRRLENEKKLESVAKKCQKINSFFIPTTKRNEQVQNEEDKTQQQENNLDNNHGDEDIDKNELNLNEDDKRNNSDNRDDIVETTVVGALPSIDSDESDQSAQLDSEDISSNFYRGFRLDPKEIVKKAGPKVITLFKEKCRAVTARKGRKRLFIKCLICSEHEEEAKRFSSNHKVYMAQGVRCDGQKKLKDVIDHLHGTPHEAAMKRAKLMQQWNNNVPNYLLLRTMKSNDPAIINTLVHMAVDVFNDSKLLTPFAWSWPSRSLACIHAEEQAKKYTDSKINS